MSKHECKECRARFGYLLDLYEHLVRDHDWRPSRTRGLERSR